MAPSGQIWAKLPFMFFGLKRPSTVESFNPKYFFWCNDIISFTYFYSKAVLDKKWNSIY